MTQTINNLAFVFPGQGSQSIGMATDLANHHPEVKQLFQQASDVLGLDLWQLVAEGPEAELNQTQNTQPALLATGVALWQIWCKQTELRPAWLAGHSLGEYTALVCANALSFADGIKLVAQRGKLMQEAVPAGVGAMAAILGWRMPKLLKSVPLLLKMKSFLLSISIRLDKSLLPVIPPLLSGLCWPVKKLALNVPCPYL